MQTIYELNCCRQLNAVAFSETNHHLNHLTHCLNIRLMNKLYTCKLTKKRAVLILLKANPIVHVQSKFPDNHNLDVGTDFVKNVTKICSQLT